TFSNEFWLQILIYAITFGITYGQIKARICSLETKVEKHNCLVERIYSVEASTKSAHHRIDELREELT
ncbi:MAG: hypothetical protein RR205_05265, partial [Oscillospiraceae bacterium]